jgi:hypothetical protein
MKGWWMDAVYTDFSKAFERVNHGLLLSNLSVMFHGSLLCWMGSYLTDRTQQIQLDDYIYSKPSTETQVYHKAVIWTICFLLQVYQRNA